ncbi:hypothetical protein Plhal304r1_c025g0084231 [Plasmopara halstedii]
MVDIISSDKSQNVRHASVLPVSSCRALRFDYTVQTRYELHPYVI